MPNENKRDDQSFVAQLEKARSILDDLIKGLSDGKKPTLVATKAISATSTDGLPDHILRLREKGFFKAPKTTKEVHEALQSTYACAADRVAMALLRLQRKKMLRKASVLIGKKKQVAYVW